MPNINTPIYSRALTLTRRSRELHNALRWWLFNVTGQRMYKGYFDGAANPNPGELGMGASIVDKKGQEMDWSYAWRANGTNNDAEYLSLILLLKRALYLGINRIACFGDSKLVINQVNGQWKCASETLKPLHQKVISLANKFNHIEFNWISRNLNTRADALSKQAVIEKKQQHKSHQKDARLLGKVVNKNTEIQSVQAAISTLKTKSAPGVKARVHALKDGMYLIVEPLSVCVFNARKHTCTCPTYIREHRCHHVDAYADIKAGTKQLREKVVS